MSLLKTTDGTQIYFEEHGSEKNAPLLILNGIMMSTPSWSSFISGFSKHFRLILMDFRDQGRSERKELQYHISVHVSDVVDLLDHLKIAKANIVGLSYGGQVAEMLAIGNPDRVKSLVLANTPARISPYLAELGEAWKEAAELFDGERFFKLAIPFIYSDYFYNRNLAWLKERQKMFKSTLDRQWFEGFIRLISSNPDFNVLDELDEIQCPTLLIGADRDIITPIEEMKMIHERVRNSEFLVIKDAGHGAFLEKSEEFMTATIGFVLKNR
ncbi:MAG TPA: alpha/beta hydrolase [Mesotoga infera]|uniref:Alpha/beta hydrolase n=1 Tax=Mesotoga infera TaxID=1236046 RepID=A0A7C1CVI1_9BACT|nr:alpha/beta hydrolase [Mesotoga infera]